MFADNERISQRQLQRQMLLTFGGVLLLLFSGEIARGGQNALIGLLTGYGALLLYFFFVIRNGSAYRHVPELFRGVAGWFVFFLCGSFFILTGGFLLDKVGQISRMYLISEGNPEFLKAAVLLTVLLGMGGSLQKRGRMAEAVFLWIFLGLCLFLILAAASMRVPDAGRFPETDVAESARWGYRYFAIGCTAGLFPVFCPRVQGTDGQWKIFAKTWLLLTLLIGAAAIIILGTYGYPGSRSMELPILSLMAGTSLPGGFLNRFDIIWMAILLFCLLFTIGSLLFYCERLAGERIRGALPVSALFMWMASNLKLQDGKGIGNYFPRLLEYVFAPLFVLLLFLTRWGLRRLYEEKREKKLDV